jgi:hypothetical protein
MLATVRGFALVAVSVALSVAARVGVYNTVTAQVFFVEMLFALQVSAVLVNDDEPVRLITSALVAEPPPFVSVNLTDCDALP